MLILNTKKHQKQLRLNWFETLVFNVGNRMSEWASRPKYQYIDHVIYQHENLRFE